MKPTLLSLLSVLWLALSACTPSAAPTAEAVESSSPLNVVVTTSIVADVVKNIGGERVTVTTLLPIGADVHNYEPAPQDVARVADADLVFVNGAGLEEFLRVLIENAGAAEQVIEVSAGIELKDFGAHAGEETGNFPPAAEHTDGDPHTWTDPNNVKIWVENIRAALTAADPAGEAAYNANAEAYLKQLDEMDAWIREQVTQIPPQNRKLVTDHLLFGYFAERYGFEQVSAIIPAYSTAAQPTAQEVAEIENAIRALGVKAVFVGKTVNPALAQRVAEDTGIRLVGLYHGSLSEPGGEAATYLDYLRYNVTQIVNALK